MTKRMESNSPILFVIALLRSVVAADIIYKRRCNGQHHVELNYLKKYCRAICSRVAAFLLLRMRCTMFGSHNKYANH